MDPYDEQTLTEEVLYLHSLWHQGPPTQRPPLHIHPPSSPSSYLLHDLSNRSQFKKKRPRKNLSGPYYLKNANDLRSPPEKEWPVTSSPAAASNSSWPTPLSKSNSITLLPSPEEKARLAASRAQVKGLNATIDFLSSDDYDEDDDDDDLEEMEEDDDDEDDSREKIHRFFVNLFTDDCGLKEYYLKNYSNGEFNCLVCGWTLKKYRDCAALVQHSNSIAKKRRVHRVYGQAVCNLLGWEIDKLPQIISDLSEKVKDSLNKSSVCVAENETQETIAGESKECSSIPLDDDEHQKKDSADSGYTPNNGDSVISEEPKVEASACEGEAKNDGPGDA